MLVNVQATHGKLFSALPIWHCVQGNLGVDLDLSEKVLQTTAGLLSNNHSSSFKLLSEPTSTLPPILTSSLVFAGGV